MMDRATEYAAAVAARDVDACELHRLACKRHLSDLERQGEPGFPFIWNAEASERVLRFAEKLTLAEGFRPGPLKLYPFQCFDIGAPFGWLNDMGCRRFRRKYKSISRQHGKSLENGIQGTYIAGFSGYCYGQLYTAATKQRQAKIVWKEMAKFIAADPDLAEFFKVVPYQNLITARNTQCTIEALSRDSSLDDGFRPLYASIDELHQMRDNSVYKALQNGSRNMPETLISMITTRGFDTESFAFEMDKLAISVLRGDVAMDDFFADIYCLDDGDDPFDESVWIKANPILAATESGMQELRREAETARAMGGAEMRDFLTKGMNMWVRDTETEFIPHGALADAKCNLTLDDFRGERCWVGIDLSSGGDLTSISLEFDADGKTYAYSHSFMPRGRMAEHIASDVAPYDLWEREGLITAMGGATDFGTDYKFIIRHLDGLIDEYGLEPVAIGYDNHNADAFLADLDAYGVPLVKVVQSAANLNDATVDMQLLAKSGKLLIDERNELLAWSLSNAELVRNSFGEVKIDKKPSARQRRIDPVDALIDAHFARLATKGEPEIDVEGEMARYMELMGFSTQP